MKPAVPINAKAAASGTRRARFRRKSETIGEKCRSGRPTACVLHQSAAVQFGDDGLDDLADLFAVEAVSIFAGGAAADRLVCKAVLGQQALQSL